jgi:hypothetical protein
VPRAGRSLSVTGLAGGRLPGAFGSQLGHLTEIRVDARLPSWWMDVADLTHPGNQRCGFVQSLQEPTWNLMIGI